MRAHFAGVEAVSHGQLLGAALLIGALGAFYFAQREEPPPAAQPERAAVFPAFRQVPDGSAVLRDPFAARTFKAPAANAPLPFSPLSAAEQKAVKRAAAPLPKLSGIASQGARKAAVFVWGKETKVCAAGAWIGPYRVDSLAADGAVLTGPEGVLRLQVGR